MGSWQRRPAVPPIIFRGCSAVSYTHLDVYKRQVYNIVDTAYIGLLDSDTALAAVGVTLPLLLIFVSIENIFAAGAAVLAGRQLGAGEKEKARCV